MQNNEPKRKPRIIHIIFTGFLLIISSCLPFRENNSASSANLTSTPQTSVAEPNQIPVPAAPIATKEIITTPLSTETASSRDDESTVATVSPNALDVSSHTVTLEKVEISVTKTVAPTATLRPIYINEVSAKEFVVLTEEVLTHTREIYAKGQSLGRNPQHFSVLGDSAVATTYFLSQFDTGPYNLADYAYLQDTIDHFSGSFSRQNITVRQGLNSWAVLDPMWGDKDLCQPNETMLACEFRVHNPSIILIILGTNDWTGAFEENIRAIVDFAIENGVVPILTTKANRVDGDSSPRNQILRQVADDSQIPLWDFDLIADTLPNRGLDVDGVHMLIFPSHNYTLPQAFETGYGSFNLSALVVLDRMWKQVIQTAPD